MRILLPVFLVVVGLAVWLPQPTGKGNYPILGVIAHWLSREGLPLIPSYVGVNIVANVAMFLPFGILLMVAFRRMRVWSVTLIGFAASGLIEGVQLFLPTRDSSIADLLTNTLGALLGALLVAVVRRMRRAAPERSAVVAPTA